MFPPLNAALATYPNQKHYTAFACCVGVVAAFISGGRNVLVSGRHLKVSQRLAMAHDSLASAVTARQCPHRGRLPFFRYNCRPAAGKNLQASAAAAVRMAPGNYSRLLQLRSIPVLRKFATLLYFAVQDSATGIVAGAAQCVRATMQLGSATVGGQQTHL